MGNGQHDPRFCDCCGGSGSLTPAVVLNRPGLSALQYRVGVFASFRRSMLEGISRDRRLDAFTNRASDDTAISVLETFAAVGDVLTFYSERLINELYLRTALERDSVLRLVRLTGYRLRPGLSATTDLAFRLEEGAALTLRRGLKVMSVPAAEEVPVFFETLEDLEADAALDVLPVFGLPSNVNAFERGREEAPLAVLPGTLSSGDQLVMFGLERVEEKRLEALDAARDGPRASFSPAVQGEGWWSEVAQAAGVLRRLHFFGHDAPDSYQAYIADDTISPLDRWQSFPISHLAPGFSGPIALDRVYDDLAPGDQLLIDAGAGVVPRLRTVVVAEIEAGAESVGTRTETVSRIRVRESLRGAAVTVEGHHFARTGSGTLVQMDRGGGNTAWSLLALNVSSDPAVVRAPSRWEIFSRAANGRLNHHTVQEVGGAVAFSDLDGVLTSRPEPVRMAIGELRVFVRGLDFALWQRQAGPGVGPWESLGGVLTSAPAAVEPAPGVLHVYVRGLDRGLWRRVRSGAVWSGWERLRGVLAGDPVAVSSAAGVVEVAALDDAGGLVLLRESAIGLEDWLSLGGDLEGLPALVAGHNRLDVFATGRDGTLQQRSRINGQWGGWVSLGGRLGASPGADRVGGQVQVVAPGVDGVLAERVLQGSGWGPWRSLGDGMPPVPDRRQARISQISAERIAFRGYDYPAAASGSAVAVQLPAGADVQRLTRLFKGRRGIVKSADDALAVTVAEAVPFAMVPGELPDHLRLGLVDPLDVAVSGGDLLGNVVRASHGETRPAEALGGEVGAAPLRTARLANSPLAYLADPQQMAGAPELDLRVGGVRWKAVDSLYGQGSSARVFTLRETDAGETEITFGDGTHGARPPGDVQGIQALYRVGSGLQGRVRAGQLSVLLEKPPGLRSVNNPRTASGAADPEPRDRARENAPAQLSAFGRVVSLQDFVAVARATGLVAKSHITWVWQALERAAHLSVIGPGGSALNPDDLALLHAMLDASRMPYRRLTIAGIVLIPVVVQARIVVAADWSRDDAVAAARAALEALFAFESTPIGRAVHGSAVYAALHQAPGVAAADVDVFNVKGYADLGAAQLALRSLTPAPLQAQVRAYPARPTPANPADVDPFAAAAFDGPLPPVLPAEQIHLASPAEDIRILVTEAL